MTTIITPTIAITIFLALYFKDIKNLKTKKAIKNIVVIQIFMSTILFIILILTGFII